MVNIVGITCSVLSLVTWLSRILRVSKLVRQSHGQEQVALILIGFSISWMQQD